MITIFGLKLSYEAAIFFGLFIASEVIGLSKYRSNSVVQVFLKVVTLLKPLRSEDDKIRKFKDSLR
jgi:hypothetical protein